MIHRRNRRDLFEADYNGETPLFITNPRRAKAPADFPTDGNSGKAATLKAAGISKSTADRQFVTEFAQATSASTGFAACRFARCG